MKLRFVVLFRFSALALRSVEKTDHESFNVALVSQLRASKEPYQGMFTARDTRVVNVRAAARSTFVMNHDKVAI